MNRACLALAFMALAGCSQPPAKTAPPTWRDGVYVGSNFTGLGRAKVQVTIKDGKIAAIKTLSHFCSKYGAKAYGVMEPRIVAAQSPEVDAVTGATYSSHNIQKAVRDALAKAAAPKP